MLAFYGYTTGPVHELVQGWGPARLPPGEPIGSGWPWGGGMGWPAMPPIQLGVQLGVVPTGGGATGGLGSQSGL